ncbi:MAG: hypothetical protein IJ017_05290 [Oscillospiraceae bacterium]|nr:hypothetical protein [Oscillospiraceae bacterium]
MKMITAVQAAEKWKLSLRAVQNLCRHGKIHGAERFGSNWMIPESAVRPVDGRSKAGKDAKKNPALHRPLIRKSPFLDMTDLYNTPGTADKSIAALSHHPEAQALFAAEIAYSRCEIDKVYEHANFFLHSHSGFYAVISGGLLLSLSAMWKGDLQMWYKARQHIMEAPCKNSEDRDIVLLTLAAADSAIRNTDDFPDWFARGCFDHLPRDAHPAARVYYIKHLLIAAQELALGKIERAGVRGFGLMKTLPYVIEPMISQMVVDKVIMAEIYLRLCISIAYHQYGDDMHAAEHLDKAIMLCLPDRLYGPLVEHRTQLGPFLDDRLAMVDQEALRQVKVLHKQLHANWTRLHNAVLDKQVQVTLTNREREVSRLAAFGMTDSQIAAQLHLSESSVKAAIRTSKNKTGVNSRKELANFI